MGVYDTYDDIQLKVGPMHLDYYAKGDTVPIPDGVYVSPHGVVVILNNILAGTFENLTSKWGDELSPSDVVRKVHPIIQALEIIKEQGLEID